MNAGRFISASKARDASKQVTYLPKTMAEGKVKKTVLYQVEPSEPGDFIEAFLLEVEPGARILEHKNLTENEDYIFDTRIETYPCGQSHGFVNATEKVVKILVVKHAVIVNSEK